MLVCVCAAPLEVYDGSLLCLMCRLLGVLTARTEGLHGKGMFLHMKVVSVICGEISSTIQKRLCLKDF